jgi:hypothetical protein
VNLGLFFPPHWKTLCIGGNHIMFVGQNLAKICDHEPCYLLHLWRFVGKFGTRLVQFMLGFNFQLPRLSIDPFISIISLVDYKILEIMYWHCMQCMLANYIFSSPLLSTPPPTQNKSQLWPEPQLLSPDSPGVVSAVFTSSLVSWS